MTTSQITSNFDAATGIVSDLGCTAGEAVVETWTKSSMNFINNHMFLITDVTVPLRSTGPHTHLMTVISLSNGWKTT